MSSVIVTVAKLGKHLLKLLGRVALTINNELSIFRDDEWEVVKKIYFHAYKVLLTGKTLHLPRLIIKYQCKMLSNANSKKQCTTKMEIY